VTLKLSPAELEAAGRKVGGAFGHAEGNGTSATGSASHAEGVQTVASGTGTHAEGESGQASGYAGHAEGVSTVASGGYSHAEGYFGQATATASHVEGGNGTAAGNYSHAGGWRAKADGHGSWARASGTLTSASRFQVAMYTLGVTTASTTANQVLTFDHSGTANVAAGTANVLVVPTFGNYLFELTLSVRLTGTATRSCGWVYKGLVARDSGSARIVGTVTQVTSWADGTTLGTVAITADTTNQALQVAVTPSVATSMPWFGVLTVNELVATS
jgi:hypothetical protein